MLSVMELSNKNFYKAYYLLNNEIISINDYLVSPDGDILSLKSSKILKPSFDKYGYLKVTLYIDGMKKNIHVHKLVGTTFNLELCKSLLKKLDKVVFDHINRNRADNRSSNIRPTSISENVRNISDKDLLKRKFNMIKNREHLNTSKKVFVDDLKFNSIVDASRYLNSTGVEKPLDVICKNFSSSLRNGYKCYGRSVGYVESGVV